MHTYICGKYPVPLIFERRKVFFPANFFTYMCIISARMQELVPAYGIPLILELRFFSVADPFFEYMYSNTHILT